jgi:hypothetical protein
MKNENKFPIGWAITGVVVALIIGLGTNIVGIYNYGNRAEKQVVAEHKNLENVLGQYSIKVAEVAQVPDMYKEDMKEVVNAALQGRYGANGSKAVFQWLKEDNSPAKLDSALYGKIQQIIEAGRNEFQNNQTRFIDIKRVYETNLGYAWKGLWLGVFGYPRIDLDKYQITTTDAAANALQTGRDAPIQLRKP